MFKKGMFAAGALMLAVSATNVPTTVHAQAKVEATQDAEGKKILETFLSSGLALDIKLTFGSVTFDKSKGEIIATDVGFGLPGMKANYKKIMISGYKADSSTETYNMDKATLSDMSVTIDPEHFKELKTPNSPPFGSMSFGRFEYSGISGSHKKGFISVENVTGSGMKLDAPNVPDLSNIKITMSGMKAKNLHEMAKFQKEMMTFFQKPIQPGTPMPPEMLKYLTLVYSNISWEKASMTGFPEFPAPDGQGSFKIDEFFMGKISEGVLEEITLKGLNVNNPNDRAVTSVKIGKLSILGFDMLEMVKHSSTVTPGTPPTPEQGAKFFQFIKGLSIQGVNIKGPAQEVSGGADINWGNFVGLFPTKISWDAHTSITAPKGAPAGPGYAVFLKMAGLDKLDIKSSMGIDWDEKTNNIVIKPFNYSADKLADIEFSATIGNVTKEMLEERDINKLGIMALGANVGTITLKVTDKGAQKLADETTKGMWSAMSAEFSADPKLQPVVQNITKLLNEPGSKLTIVLKPKGVMSFAQVSGAIVLGPKMIPTLFDIETSLEK